MSSALNTSTRGNAARCFTAHQRVIVEPEVPAGPAGAACAACLGVEPLLYILHVNKARFGCHMRKGRDNVSCFLPVHPSGH